MPWPIHITRTVVVWRHIRASEAQVSEIASDVESYLRFQPFITKMVQDVTNPRLYRVTERVPAPASLWMFDNSFSIAFEPVEDQDGRGMNMSAKIDQSFLFPKLVSRVRVKETEEHGVLELVEILEVQASCIFSRRDIKNTNTQRLYRC